MPGLAEYPFTGSSLNNKLADGSQQSHTGVCRCARLFQRSKCENICGCRSKTFREKVSKELECLEKNGVIELVQHADWAAPIVLVLKQDGLVHICGDYKLTVNQAAKTDSFPLPRIDIFFLLWLEDKHFQSLI